MDEQRLIQLELSDEALVEQVARQDVNAFIALYDRHAQVVYSMAAHMLGVDEAEEVVQDVFLRLWNRAAQFDATRGTFNGWFMTIARNQIMDGLRRRSQRQRVFVTGEISGFLEEIADQRVDIEAEAWGNEQGDAIQQALRALPAEQRRVLILAYFGGFSQSEIARLLDCPFGTVKKRMRLGMKKLQAALASEGLVEPVDAASDRDQIVSSDNGVAEDELRSG